MSGKRNTVTTVGEYGLHEWLRTAIPYAREVGIGDDAAKLPLPIGNYSLLVTTDFVRIDRSGRHAGQLVVIQNLSDIICKGGKPIAVLLGIKLTRRTSIAFFQRLVDTARRVTESYGALLVGGDTKEGEEGCLYGVALGVAKQGETVGRIGCRPGDVVAVTLTRNWKIGTRWAHVATTQLRAHLQPSLAAALRHAYRERWKLPFAETRSAIETGAVTASIDMSDGLGACIEILARQNDLGFDLDERSLQTMVDPLAATVARRLGVPRIKFALSPGYDWENMLTVRREAFASTRRAVRAAGGELFQIGSVTKRGDLLITTKNGLKRRLRPFTSEKLTERSHSEIATQWLEHQDYE